METKMLLDEKNSLELEVASVTIAEVLRHYLNEGGADLAVWRRDHPTKNPVLRVEGTNPKKLVKDAIKQIEKETDTLVAEFKKLK